MPSVIIFVKNSQIVKIDIFQNRLSMPIVMHHAGSQQIPYSTALSTSAQAPPLVAGGREVHGPLKTITILTILSSRLDSGCICGVPPMFIV